MKRHRIVTFVALLLIGIGCWTGGLRAQETAAPAAAPATKTEKSASDKTLWQVVQQGGWMMIPLGLTSVTLIALVLDGFLRLRNHKLAPPTHVEMIRAQFRTGDYNGAYKTCKEHPSLFTNVVRVGLGMLGHGREACQRSMEDALAKEVSTLGTRIRYLSVIGVVSPMLGLTGTVLGMIRAFATIGSSGIGDPSALAAAIGEVLVATATGLFVAIPAFAFYYVFSNRITAVTAYCEDVINGLFRGMLYEEFAGASIGNEPIYAAPPNRELLGLASVPRYEQPAAAAAPPVEEEPVEEEPPPPQPVAVPRPVAQPVARAVSAAKRMTVPQASCPNCQQPVAVGVAECPHCQTELNWGIPVR